MKGGRKKGEGGNKRREGRRKERTKGTEKHSLHSVKVVPGNYVQGLRRKTKTRELSSMTQGDYTYSNETDGKENGRWTGIQSQIMLPKGNMVHPNYRNALLQNMHRTRSVIKVIGHSLEPETA
jgi:hypothetical protein